MSLVMDRPAGELYPGETVQFKVHALCDQSTVGRVAHNTTQEDKASAVWHGTLFVTTYRLLFCAFDSGNKAIVDVLLHTIAEINDVQVHDTLKCMSQVEIACKNFQVVTFTFPSETQSGVVYVRLSQLLLNSRQPVALVPAHHLDTSGWTVFDPEAEFTRLRFPSHPRNGPTTGFRITRVNDTYALCRTYPSVFIVPASVSDGELRQISAFRARQRVPAITYRHGNNAVVGRTAQPLVGLTRKRCPSDEAYMGALQRACRGPLLFIDCRSQPSAYGNIALGGGFELAENYKATNIVFMNIENIHSMRASMRKLLDLIKRDIRGPERPHWLSCLETTRWLEHVRALLVSCTTCVAHLVNGTSLMVHCSDGWDRTAQLTALVKLCADPFYRTRKGFQVLIEQEWCSFGHQFRARSGPTELHAAAYWDNDQTSPVFMQFIDAVWQLMRQFPCSFEYSERYLLALLDDVYGKQSGTFWHDCEFARKDAKTASRYASVWTLLDVHPDAVAFRNPFYMVPHSGTGSREQSPCVLQCKWHTSALALWSSFYLRSLQSHESRDAMAQTLHVTQRALQDQLRVAHQELQSQAKQKAEMQTALEQVRRERAHLARLVQGGVYSNSRNGLLVHEEDENEDGVLLSVTAVGESRTTLETSSCTTSGAKIAKVFSTTGIGSFLGASMNQDVAIVQTHFDAVEECMRSPKE